MIVEPRQHVIDALIDTAGESFEEAVAISTQAERFAALLVVGARLKAQGIEMPQVTAW